MLTSLLGLFSKRPFIGEQTTKRDAWLGYQGQGYTSYLGVGGQRVLRSMSIGSPAGIVATSSVRIIDPTATGNVSYSPTLAALTQPSATAPDYSASAPSANQF